MKRRDFIGSLGLAASLGLAGCGSAAPAYTGIDLTGASYGRALRLHGSDGREHTLAEFKDRYVLLFFGFTQCPDVCPTTLARAVATRKLLGADGERVQVLFVTVDPERDTPALLADYMAAFDPGFLGLSGSLAETAQVAREFKIFYQKVPAGDSYTMDHTAISYVIDAEGGLRLAFKHAQSAADCAADLRALMKADGGLLRRLTG
jgi:protein SCO1/2